MILTHLNLPPPHSKLIGDAPGWWCQSRLGKIHSLCLTPRKLKCTKIQHKLFCAEIFEQFAPKFLTYLCQSFKAYLCLLLYSISEHYMLICAINTIFILSPSSMFQKVQQQVYQQVWFIGQDLTGVVNKMISCWHWSAWEQSCISFLCCCIGSQK